MERSTIQKDSLPTKSRPSRIWPIALKQTKLSNQPHKTAKGSSAEARRLLSIVEKSQVPFGQSADIYNRLKPKIEADEQLTVEEFEQLNGLVKIAKDWEKAVESSAMTEPEETLAG